MRRVAPPALVQLYHFFEIFIAGVAMIARFIVVYIQPALFAPRELVTGWLAIFAPNRHLEENRYNVVFAYILAAAIRTSESHCA
jgi:hypothetical protein